MAKDKSTDLISAPDEDQLALLRDNFPQEASFQSVQLPRIAFKSQDVTEGKGKAMKVVTEAGTFFLEKETDEEEDVIDDTGKKTGTKKVWESTELGDTLEGVIVYQRKQLKYYDENTETYTSSPIYDSEDEVIPLFCDKAEVDRGTPVELKAKYMYTDKNGKAKSKLEENRILYVLYEGELYQLNLRGSSMYSFLGYARKTLVPAVMTTFNSEPMEKGDIAWNKMTFEATRQLTKKEVVIVIEKQTELKDAISGQKAHFAAKAAAEDAQPLAAEFKKGR